jgi:ribonuclease HI
MSSMKVFIPKLVLPKLVLHTDGSCLNNGKVRDNTKAGIGVFHESGSRFNISEPWSPSLGLATNQRAEIMAVVRALEETKEVKDYVELEIRSDSSYVINGVTKWMVTWKRNGWVNSMNKVVANQDLWLRLDKLIQTHPLKLNWVHVRGHSNVHGNVCADSLATSAAKTLVHKVSTKDPHIKFVVRKPTERPVSQFLLKTACPESFGATLSRCLREKHEEEEEEDHSDDDDVCKKVVQNHSDNDSDSSYDEESDHKKMKKKKKNQSRKSPYTGIDTSSCSPDDGQHPQKKRKIPSVAR